MSEDVCAQLTAHHAALCELDPTNDAHVEQIVTILQQLPNYKVTGEIIYRSKINSKLNELGRSSNQTIKSMCKSVVHSFKSQLTTAPAPSDHEVVRLEETSQVTASAESSSSIPATADGSSIDQPVLSSAFSSGVKRKLPTESQSLGTDTNPAVIASTTTTTTTSIESNSNPSSSSSFTLGKTGSQDRDRIQLVLFDCLKSSGEVDAPYATELAVLIEQALYDHFGNQKRDYVAQARLIMSNVKDQHNPDFRLRISTGAIAPGDLPTMPVHEMASEQSKAERQNLLQYELEARKTDLDSGSTGVDMFPCPKCHAKKTSFYQKQTRSADEPMTIFCRCMKCNHRWRIY